MNNQELMKDFDELERLVENSPGFLGKRIVSEEAFLTQMLVIRRKFADDEKQSRPPTGENLPWSDPK